MHPQELAGLWDSGPYDYGVMESNALGLLPNGLGWDSWFSASDGFNVRRLRWRSPEPGVIELHYTLSLSGTWTLGQDRSERLSIDSQHRDNEILHATYTLLTDTTLLSPEPFPALHLSQAVEFCYAFGLRQRHVTITSDPTHGVVPYPTD